MQGIEEVEQKKFERKRLWIWFHWIGFLFLLFFIFRMFIGFNPQLWTPEGVVIVFDPPRFWLLEILIYEFFRFELNSVVNWLAVTHYPIKSILSGNKSFFPWRSADA